MVKQFRVPRQDKPPLDFELVYDRFDKEDGEWKECTEKFHARGSIPGNLLMSIAASMSASAGLQAHEMTRLLTRAIMPDDKEKFVELLDDPDTAIPIETLGDILNWLAEVYGERPTQNA